MMLTLAAIAGVTFVKGVGPLLYITENYVQLISAAVAMSLVQVGQQRYIWLSYEHVLMPDSADRLVSFTLKVTGLKSPDFLASRMPSNPCSHSEVTLTASFTT